MTSAQITGELMCISGWQIVTEVMLQKLAPVPPLAPQGKEGIVDVLFEIPDSAHYQC